MSRSVRACSGRARVPSRTRLLTCLLAIVALAAAGSGCRAPAPGSDAAGTAAAPPGSTAATPADTKGEAMEGELKVTSSAYAEGGRIPAEYCYTTVSGGKNRSVPLEWTAGPEGTESYVVVMLDKHPMAAGFVHWLVVDIQGDTTSLLAGASGSMPAGAKELANDFGGPGYGGPAAPPGTGDHRYESTVYALSVPGTGLAGRASAAELDRALAGKVLARGVLNGVFSR